MMKLLLAAVLVICFVNVKVTAQGACVRRNSCSCAYADNKVIDLSSLAFNNGTARWSGVWDKYYASRYSYNPCFNFTESTCVNSSVCRFDGVVHASLGSQASAEFTTDSSSGQPAIVFNSTDSLGVSQLTEVVLICVYQGPDVFKAIGETDPTHFVLHLISTHCCPK